MMTIATRAMMAVPVTVPRLKRGDEMQTFTAAVIASVSAALQDMIGRTVAVGDLCDDISEFQNSDGFWVYGTEESADFLRKHRIEAAEMYDEICECGDINPFANPEGYLCMMYIIKSHEIVASLPWILAHDGETVRLTPTVILAITSELEAVRNGDGDD